MRWLVGLSAILSGVILSAPAHAAVVSTTFSPVLVVDAASGTTTLSVTALDFAGPIVDFNITLDFTKCGTDISAAGVCSATGFSFNREIEFKVTSPGGTTVDLVDTDTYSGQDGGTVQVVFDDEAATAVGGALFVSEVFRSVGLLSAFDGQSAIGDWIIFYRDSLGGDPLSLNAVSLEFTGDVAVVPLPAAMPLFGTGLAVLGYLGWRRKRRVAESS